MAHDTNAPTSGLERERAQHLPGEDADRPGQIPPRGWVQVAKRVKDEAKADNASLLAGGVAFFGLLALVPLLVAVLAIWGISASPADATRLIQDLASGLPNSAQRLVPAQLHSIAKGSRGGHGVT